MQSDQLLQNTPPGQEVDIQTLSADQIRQKSFFYSVAPQTEDGKPHRATKTNQFFSYLSIIKTIVGVGILGFPRVMREWGVGIALTLMLLFVFLGHIGSILLLRAKNLSKHSNFSTIARYTVNSKYQDSQQYNKFVYWIRTKGLVFYTHFAVLINNLGICVSELIIFGQIIQNLIQRQYQELYKKDKWYLSITFTSFIILIIIGPLFYLRRIQKLRFLSIIGISAILVFLFCQIIVFTQREKKSNNFTFGIPKYFNIWKAMSTVPNIVLAYSYQMNLFPIYKGLKNPSDQKILKTAFVALVSCFLLYFSVGFFGYYTFGQNTQVSNYLQVLSIQTVKQRIQIQDWLFILINLVFIVNVTCSIPFLFFGARNNFVAIIQILFFQRDYTQQKESYMLKQSFQKRFLKNKDLAVYIGLTTLLLLIIYVIAVTVRNIGFIFNIIGAVSANSICLILPSLFVWLLSRKLNINDKFTKLSIIIFCISIPLGLLCVACQIIETVQPQ